MNKKLLLWVFGIILLTFITIISGFGEIVSILSSLDIFILLLFIVSLCSLQLITLSLTSYQWYYLFRESAEKIPFSKIFLINQTGGFVESVTPSSKMGGEVTKLYLFNHLRGIGYEKLTSLLLAHKYISLVPFLLLCLLTLLLTSFFYTMPFLVYASFALLAVITFLLFLLIYHEGKSRGLPEHLDIGPSGFDKLYGKFRAAVCFVQRASNSTQNILTPKTRNSLFMVSLLVWALYPLKIYVTANVLGIQISFLLAVVVTYAAYLVSMLPITPGGLGTFEGSMALVLRLNGFFFAEGMAIALLARAITFWFPLLVSAGSTMYLIKKEDVEVFGHRIV